tara:strand:+ start:259 stop:1065 length:807 start_codon:yes stop_codon:yes gene_type:complete
MVEAYGYKQQIITELNNIDNNTNNFYNYKGLNFLSKLSCKNENLVIIFHSAIPNSKKGEFNVVFRGYNYTIDNTDIICISDYLLTKYKDNYTVNWTLSTKKYANLDLLYNKLFEYIINKKIYKNIVFTGTSAGGFPSLKFGSFFNATVIISNSQLYIENYFNNKGLAKIKKYIDNDDEVIYKNKMIEKIILQSKPKKIIYYQNKEDINHKLHSSYEDCIQFKNFLESNNLENICEFLIFTLYNQIPHYTHFPDNKKHINILKEFIKNN